MHGVIQSQGHLIDAATWYIFIILSHSYEFMRKNLIFYRTEIHRLTGKVRLILGELID